MPAKSYLGICVVLLCMYMRLFCNFVYLCVYVRLLWPAAIPPAVILVKKNSPRRRILQRRLGLWGVVRASVHTTRRGTTTTVSKNCSSSGGSALIPGLSKRWVKSWRPCQGTRRSATDGRWDGCRVIGSEGCSANTKQRVCSPCSRRDRLNSRCSTAGTQAHWINKHRRSKDDCCVCVWANRQRAGRCSFLLPSVVPDLRQKKRDFMCSLKKHNVKVLQEDRSATKIQIDSQVLGDF